MLLLLLLRMLGVSHLPSLCSIPGARSGRTHRSTPACCHRPNRRPHTPDKTSPRPSSLVCLPARPHYFPIYPSIYPSVCLSIYSSVCPSPLLPHLPMHLCVHLSVCLPINLLIYLPVFITSLSIHPSVRPSIYRPPVCLSIYLSIYYLPYVRDWVFIRHATPGRSSKTHTYLTDPPIVLLLAIAAS